MRAKFALFGFVGFLTMGGPAVAQTMDAPEVWQTTAVPAAAFLSSLGVNTHVAQGYDYNNYIPAIKYLGVRNVRDAAGYVSNLIDLHNKTGVLVDIFNGGNLNTLIRAGQSLAQYQALLSFEGANEPNNFPITYNGATGGGSGTWVPVANFQRDIYTTVKSDPTLKSYPVFHVSEGGAEVDNVGLQWPRIPSDAKTTMPPGVAYADYANPHNYVSGNCNQYVDNQAWQAADPILNACWDGLYVEYGRTWRDGYPGPTDEQLRNLPRVTTETGWDTVSNPGGEDVQGKVLVNTYLSQYARGWRYTFIYELGEGEGGGGNQGLFHTDWTPKLSATYIHNLTTILADSSSPASPGILNYYIPHKPVTVHNLLMQKSTGAFELVVWGEQVSGSNYLAVKLGGTHAKVNVYDVTSGVAPIQTLTNVSGVHLTVSDHALVVEVIS